MSAPPGYPGAFGCLNVTALPGGRRRRGANGGVPEREEKPDAPLAWAELAPGRALRSLKLSRVAGDLSVDSSQRELWDLDKAWDGIWPACRPWNAAEEGGLSHKGMPRPQDPAPFAPLSLSPATSLLPRKGKTCARARPRLTFVPLLSSSSHEKAPAFPPPSPNTNIGGAAPSAPPAGYPGTGGGQSKPVFGGGGAPASWGGYTIGGAPPGPNGGQYPYGAYGVGPAGYGGGYGGGGYPGGGYGGGQQMYAGGPASSSDCLGPCLLALCCCCMMSN